MLRFIKKEPVLVIATILMIISMFFVRPNPGYFSYIDFKVLVLLFCLMAVVSGLRSQGVFRFMAKILTKRIKTIRTLTLVLCILCFFTAMLITNDVVLLTFIPLTLVMLSSAKEFALIRTIVLETIAANLGSMFTPIGNPQNLYLYNKGGYDPISFCRYMLLPTLICLAFIVLLCFFASSDKIQMSVMEDPKDENGNFIRPKAWKIVLYGILFVICLLNVFHVLHYAIVLGIVLLAFLIVDRKCLLKVDYMLLLTFVAFFVLIGNLGQIDIVRNAIESMLEGRVFYVSILASQILSNVPAAMLLSEFTNDTDALLLGVNLGGLGTIIASMASLISYKLYATRKESKKGLYMGVFSLMNFGLLVVLTVLLPLLMKLAQ